MSVNDELKPIPHSLLYTELPINYGQPMQNHTADVSNNLLAPSFEEYNVWKMYQTRVANLY